MLPHVIGQSNGGAGAVHEVILSVVVVCHGHANRPTHERHEVMYQDMNLGCSFGLEGGGRVDCLH